jgi:hypothetical protein
MTSHMIGTAESTPAGAAPGAAEWMGFAAAPTFAINVHADVCLPFGAVAVADLWPATPCQPLLIPCPVASRAGPPAGVLSNPATLVTPDVRDPALSS